MWHLLYILTLLTATEPVLARSISEEKITIEFPGGATMEMVWIELGSFMMGSRNSVRDRYRAEGPQHQVAINQGFYLGKLKLPRGNGSR